MQTFKTAVVVILLLALLYGVYVVLSKPEAQEAASELARELVPAGRAPREPAPDDSQANPWVTLPADAQSAQPPLGSSGIPGPAGSPGPAIHMSHAQPAADWPPPDPGHLTHSAHPSPGDSRAEPAGPARDIQPATAESYLPGVAAPQGPDAPDRAARPSADRDATAVYSAADPAAAASGNPGPARQLGGQAFAKAMRTARAQISAGQFREALYTLSIFHGSPDLTAEEHGQLLDLLDPLAGRVVYSTEHLLEEAYEVRRNETLFDIAERYQVPWQLLQNINGVRDPQVLVPGTKLKVVPGPFRAEVDLERGELTVFLGRLYAGRFPVTLGQDPSPVPGSYEVRDKRFDRAYYGGGSGTIPADDPRNPYGGIWLDLGQELCIHGSPAMQGPAADRLGCISLSPRDARDVYGILSPGSQVVIRR